MAICLTVRLLAEVAGTQTAAPTYRVTDHITSLGGSIDNTGNFSGEVGFAPFGQNVSGSTSDTFRFTGLEFDTFTGLYHATARQYHPNHGRWVSPDPFTGSYNWADPQSLNRYGYVGNRPMTFTDPSGQSACAVALGAAEGGAGPYAAIPGALCIFELAGGSWITDHLLGGLFGGPSFHGTVKPRAGTGAQQPWNDTFGIPYGGLQNGVGQALGLPSGGCEFGACGSVSSFSSGADPATQIRSLYDNILEHLDKIAANPESPAVQHWRGEIEDWASEISKKATRVTRGRRPGAFDKYLQRIIGITGSDLEDLLPSPIFVVDPCLANPFVPQCSKGPYKGPV